MVIRKKSEARITIDLTGPDGNACVLLGIARRLALQLGLDAQAITTEMQAGDYEHLVATFDRHLGRLVTLYR